MRYRRAYHAGATYFFTVNLADRSLRLLVDHIDALRDAVRHVRRDHPFNIIAWVVLPDHLHAIWQLPDGDADFSTRWALIKANFSRRVPTGERIRDSRRQKGERGIWQRRFWEHLIRDDRDLQIHVDYIHFNPVKHGHARRVIDWEYSTFHHYVRLGWVTADWGCDDGFDGDFGER
ncbi:transposase [uncultured Thiocystis sp.]|jgi:putative transposase|uniref:REP-associated tyrosine transposase n=1 Tax=uncultured Thiocystis sp. TaxID=1202134 RepID=UPI0025D00378|nr:transposase [uncultured Thiocystis sp.]